MRTVKAVYFSPTGTSRAVVKSIVSGIRPETVEMIDITTPKGRKNPLHTSATDLLVIAVPVYMGRIPALLNDWLTALRADQTPTVCIAVYGNREYDDALLELKNIVTERGGIPLACAAYIGEHSFSSPNRPTAHGRPDGKDEAHAMKFGQSIREKLAAFSAADATELHVPGTFPYGGQTTIWDVDFIEVTDACVQCGHCADVCPAGATDAQDSRQIDHEKCITCCACIKRCPHNAKTMKPGPVKDAQERLNTLYGKRNEPEIFI